MGEISATSVKSEVRKAMITCHAMGFGDTHQEDFNKRVRKMCQYSGEYDGEYALPGFPKVFGLTGK